MLDKRLGYYTCNGQEFDSKIKACLYSVQVRKPIEWHFNDEVFNHYNWTEEPIETLDQLYDQRTRQLREKYDYIMLSYSGGADSHNILMSFIRQGIHLDEIVVNTMKKATDKFTVVDPNNKDNTNAAAEYQLQTFPRLKEVEQLIPKTKITVLDLTDCMFDFLEDVGDGSWVLDKREQLNIAGATRFNYIHFNDVRKQFDKDKKIALVLGIEKPRTWIKDGEFYLGFNDRAANIVTVAEHIRDYTNSSVEYFYWNPESVKIIAKQAHIIKKWLEAFPEKQLLWDMKYIQEKKTHSHKSFGHMFRTTHERILRSLLYTTWDDNWYQADKAVKDWYSEFDAWFYKGFNDTSAFNIWTDGLSYLETNLKPYIQRDESGKADGLLNIVHQYKIGNMRTIYGKT